jgi:predicted anti-sigma-YlaC factor YlaD
MSWHVQPELLEQYARGDADQAQAYSIEAHLPACSECREQIASVVDVARLQDIWEGVEERLDAPRRGPVEAGLISLGVREHIARLLGATPALRLSWLLACALVLAFAAWAAQGGESGLFSFLVLAPVLPLAGVAAAFGRDVDPTYENGLAAPMRSFDLLLIRALAVLASTTVMAAFAALALPGLQWSAAAWLLPSLGLTLASLALTTRMSAPLACGSLAVAWLVTVWTGRALTQEPLYVFGPGGQLACAVIAAAAALVLTRNADRFERRGDLT